MAETYAKHVTHHYDNHAKNTSTRQERAEGPAAPLKKYHNSIKRHLILTFASHAESLLDVACGRGGDLAKWEAAMIKTVHGVDISSEEIKEAERRLKEGKYKNNITFSVSSTLSTEDWQYGVHDVVTCMFALHYFCSSERILDHVIRNISGSLKKGGIFMGAVPDGKMIEKALKENWNGPMLRIQALWTGASRPFGCAYVCDIANTVTSGGSIEYLVDEDSLIHIAAKYGLLPITLHTNHTKLFKHFTPNFPDGTDPSLSRASQLFCTFVFKKI